MTTSVIYIADADGAYVPALEAMVQRGVPVEVDEELAESMLAQPDVWAVAGTPIPERTVTPPKAKRRSRNAPKGGDTTPESTGDNGEG